MDGRTSHAIAAFQRGELDKARELAELELAARPASSQLQHLLGLIDCRSGRLDSGIEWLRRAADGDPGNIAFRVMLVRALVDSGRAANALDAATPPPTGTSPAELALWHARAEAADAAGMADIAAEAWQLLSSVRPTDWRAWANLGEALAKLDRWEEATPALRMAARLNPAETHIRRNLASALAHAGAYEESAAELENLLAVTPDDPRLRLSLSRMFADLGRTEDSMAQLEAAARLTIGEGAAREQGGALIGVALQGRGRGTGEKLTPTDLDAIRELALLLERTNRIDVLKAMLVEAEQYGVDREQIGYAAAAVALRDGEAAEAKRLLEMDSREADPVRWHRLMAKIADSMGDADIAFAQAEMMHRAVRDYDGWRQRSVEYREGLRTLAESFAGDPMPVLKPGERRSPAFLVGFPRSGTTLADTFLMGHPGTRVLEEVHMLGAAEAALGDLRKLPQASPEQLEAARSAYFEELDRHVEPGFDGLVIDKLPLNMMGLPLIHSLFADARVIFAQRHPCDAVLSGFMQSFVLNPAMACFLDIADAADLYNVAMTLFSTGRRVTPLNVHTLVYEQLVEDPEAVLRPVIGFLGLEWRPELLDHRATASKRGAIITPSYDQVSQPLTRAPSGRWLRYEKQLEPVLPMLLPWAERLGYAD
jgi:tetratricopeptide (TPR) repeat protein